MDPIIITVAPNGARKTGADHPAIPLTPEEIAETAKAVVAEGAAMMHMHVRDENSRHTLDVGIYREAIAAVREEVGNKLIIQVTSEEVGRYTPDQQMKMVVDLKPEAVSLALCEIIPDHTYEDTARLFLRDIIKEGIMPQYILYNLREIAYFARLRRQGIIPGKQVFVLFVLGKKTLSQDNSSMWTVPDDLDPFLESFDGYLVLSETHWAACAFGGNENTVMKKVSSCGGHVRIGFETNHLLANGRPAKNNADLISQFCDSIKGTKRKVANAKTARKLLANTLKTDD